MRKAANICGLIGPVLFTIILVLLTLLKYDFLLSLGWHPIKAPTFDWPSGLSLGAYGWIMTLTFVISGLMLAIFATGLHFSLPRSAWAFFSSLLLIFAGLALAGLAFTTDPTLRTTPATWHGRFHDLSFVLLGLTLMPSMILFGFVFRLDSYWAPFSKYTWITTALAIPAFWLKGIMFYVFILSVLIWLELAALRMKRLLM